MEHGLKSEGLLEWGYDWYVQWVDPDPVALQSAEFKGVLADWKEKVRRREPKSSAKKPMPADMTVGELLGTLRPVHFWAALGAAVTVVGGAFGLGAKFFP